MEYSLTLPETYERKPLPFFNEWITALRSGEYEQGGGKLHNIVQDTYCCLGILSKVQGRLIHANDVSPACHDRKVHGAPMGLDHNNPIVELYKNSSQQSGLSTAGCFPSEVLLTIDGSLCYSLASANDRKLNFNQIADVIEKIWKPMEETE